MNYNNKIYCPSCGKENLKGASNCWKCGLPISSFQDLNVQNAIIQMDKNKRRNIYFLIGGLSIIIFFIVIGINQDKVKGKNSSQNYEENTEYYEENTEQYYDDNKPKNLSLSISDIKQKAITASYEELYRYNELYIGKIIHIKGKVVQTFQSSGYTTAFRIATKRDYYLGYYDNIIYVEYDENTRLMEDDLLEVWGEVEGLLTYTTVMGNELTIPHLYSLHNVLLSNKY